MKKLLFLLLLSTSVYAQSITKPLLTPVGSVKSFSPNITLLNNTGDETSLLGSVKDTIKPNTLVPYRPYRFEMACIVTTPALSLPNLALKVRLGSNIVAMVNATGVTAGLTNAGIRIRGTILATGISTQVVLTDIIQPNGTILNLTNANGTFYSSLTTDMTQPQALDITAQWSGLIVLGTASIRSIFYYRPDF